LDCSALTTFSRHAIREALEYAASMQLRPESVHEFATILKEEYGRDIDEREAAVLAQQLLLLYDLIYKLHPAEGITLPPDQIRSADPVP
jgi:hypothetical protein